MNIDDIQADIEALEPKHTPIHQKEAKSRYTRLSSDEKQRRRLVSSAMRRRKYIRERKRNDAMLEAYARTRMHT